MVQLPMKSQLLRVISTADSMWDHVAVERVLSQEGKSRSDYWRMMARFWLMEMSAGGLLVSIEETVNGNSYFGKGKIEYKYKLTDFGKTKVQTMLEG